MSEYNDALKGLQEQLADLVSVNQSLSAVLQDSPEAKAQALLGDLVKREIPLTLELKNSGGAAVGVAVIYLSADRKRPHPDVALI